ncbi:MAG: hypothetical protein A2Z12_04585 [Actinobacteria bacterium RBG_16_68_21]|nr:MAG: hypothetical protein A2Z12_04585 [Actinobacteria bacterium RBG_16_68_21]
MGTQRFRTSTLPALGRLARRVGKQRRLPSHVTHHLRTRLRHGWRRMVAGMAALSPARRRAARAAAAGEAVARVPGGWGIAPPAVADSAAEIAAGHLDVVASLFDGNGVTWFVTDPPGPVHHRIGVFEEHRSAAMKALADSPLHIEPGMVGREGDRRGRSIATSPRIIAWANHHIGGGHIVGPELGVEIEFWRSEPIGRVVPDGRFGIASFDPDPAPTERVVIRGRPQPTHSVFRLDIESTRVPFDVDIVYTWVDGSDPEWQRSYDVALVAAGRLSAEAANRSRYANRNELRYSMRSLWWNADFFRRVFLVTAGHRPPWLADHPRLTVIDHRDLLSAAELPTFNSHAIEARLHRIDSLSEHYLYLNDDFFFGRPLDATTFFSPNGIARIALSSAPIPPGAATAEDLPVDAAAKNGRDLLSEAVGYAPSRKLAHAPYPQVATVIREIEERFGDRLDATALARFRSPSDLSLASSLSQHYAFATARAVVGSLSFLYLNIADRWAPTQLEALAEARDRDVFCLNETSMTGAREDRVDRMVQSFLEDYFPKPSPFESL